MTELDVNIAYFEPLYIGTTNSFIYIYLYIYIYIL